MTYATLKHELEGLNPQADERAFRFLVRLSALASLADSDEEIQEARDLLIRVLELEEKRTVFADYKSIIDGLLRNVGLFPYLLIKEAGVRAQIAAEVHRPKGMPDNIIFTAKQAEVYRELLRGKSVVLSAPTSFGKSLIIDAVVASEQHKNIAVIVPTLALVDETRRRLMKFKDRYKVITHPSQTPGNRNIFVHTQERALENPNIKEVDFFVIDEFYKLTISGEADADARSILLNQAFYQLARSAKQFYMLGPNIDQLPDGFAETFDCQFIRTTFSTVTSETHMVPDGRDECERLQKLVPSLEGSTLVFSASPKKARTYSRVIASNTDTFTPSPHLDETINWLSDNFSPSWGVVQRLKKGVGTHHAKLPRSVAQMMVRLFNKAHLNHLVCTSTLIEGVNTAARNVVIVDNKISNKKYKYFTYNNIRGRAGRMWEHFVGHVYLFHEPPTKELDFVDVPIFTQDESTPDALLVQLEKDDLTQSAARRMEPVWGQVILDLDTIKANAAFDPMSQVNLAREIETNLAEWRPLLCWEGFPTYEQLNAAVGLACEHLGFKASTDIKTPKSLVYRLNQYRSNSDFAWQLAKSIEGKEGDDADEALEAFLEFTRQWVSFRAPRWLRALDRIQHRVFSRHNIKPGNYSFFAGQLESLFMAPPIVALEEYGVPIQLAQKLHPQLGSPATLDEALDTFARTNPQRFKGLSNFERRLIKPLCMHDATS